jgi:hypothetical protein
MREPCLKWDRCPSARVAGGYGFSGLTQDIWQDANERVCLHFGDNRQEGHGPCLLMVRIIEAADKGLSCKGNSCRQGDSSGQASQAMLITMRNTP